MKVWHIDSSARIEGSHSRRLTKQVIDSLSNKRNIVINSLNVAVDLPFLTELMVQGFFTANDERTVEQKLALTQSDKIVKQAKDAEVWVIGIPLYNFSMPASFKAFFDLLARSKETFTYGENGPIGLLENKRVIVVVTTGGVEIGSEYDFLTPWLKHCLGFIGITDIQFIHADKYSSEQDLEITKQIESATNSL